MNTFQAVLTTDGNSSFVYFLYRDIQWGGAVTSIGFNARNGASGFNLPESTSTEDVLNLENLSNIDVPGAFLFRVDGASSKSEVYMDTLGSVSIIKECSYSKCMLCQTSPCCCICSF